MPVTEFFVSMNPPTATAQEKKVAMIGGRPRFYDPPKVKAAKAELTAEIAPFAPKQPLTKAVRLTVEWHFPKIKGRKNGEYKTTRPDTDNLQKALKDIMTKLGFWKDDALVVSELTEKFWADTPGIFIRIEEV